MKEQDYIPRVVVLASRFPFPLEKGDKLRLYNHIRVLSQHTSVFLFAIEEREPEKIQLDQLRSFCHKIYVFRLPRRRRLLNIILRFFTSMPIQVSYFYDRRICKLMQEMIEELNPDTIYCQLVRMAPYARGLSGYRIIDYMDSYFLNTRNSNIYRWPLKIWESKKIAAYEFKVYSWFNRHFVISERDRRMFSDIHRDSIALLPNGVKVIPSTETNAEKTYDVLFWGNLGYKPNLEAAEFLIDRIHPLVPELKICLAGARCPVKLFRRQSDKLKVLGYVPEVDQVIAQSRMLVAPIFTGSGAQNKVLEAMAAGLPCITTSFCNAGIGAIRGSQVLLAETPEEFKKQIIILLSQPELRKSLIENGKQFVTRNFDWQINTEKLIDAIIHDK